MPKVYVFVRRTGTVLSLLAVWGSRHACISLDQVKAQIRLPDLPLANSQPSVTLAI